MNFRTQFTDLAAGSGDADRGRPTGGQGAVIEATAVPQAPSACIKAHARDNQHVGLNDDKRIGQWNLPGSADKLAGKLPEPELQGLARSGPRQG